MRVVHPGKADLARPKSRQRGQMRRQQQREEAAAAERAAAPDDPAQAWSPLPVAPTLAKRARSGRFPSRRPLEPAAGVQQRENDQAEQQQKGEQQKGQEQQGGPRPDGNNDENSGNRRKKGRTLVDVHGLSGGVVAALAAGGTAAAEAAAVEQLSDYERQVLLDP